MLPVFLFLASLFFPFLPDNDPEAEIQAVVQQLFSDTEFAFGDTALSGEAKSVSGTITYRKKHQLDLKASYDTDNKLGSVSLSFASGSGLGISDGAWQKLAGENLAPYLPKELASSVRVNAIDLHLNKEAEQKLDHVGLHYPTLADWSFLRTRGSAPELALENIKVRLNVASPSDKKKRRVTGQLTGNTKIGPLSVQLGAELFPERE